MQQKKLILVAATTGYQTRSFATAATRLGFAVVLATDRCHVMDDPWADGAIAIDFDKPESSAEAIVLACPGASGIVAVADRPTTIAALTAERLGLRFHPPAATRICRDKHSLRQAFEAAGLLVPNYRRVAPGAPIPAELHYPYVLKPLTLSGSRGVIRANTPIEAAAALQRIRAMLPENEPVQAEDYIPGREFALEGLVTDGQLQVLAVFDKPDPLEGPFFEETIYVTPCRESAATQNAIVETTQRAANAIGLTDGPIHAEMRVNGQGVYMLEIAARPIGGLCSRALRFSRNLNLEDLVILHAVGQLPALLEPASPAAAVMMIPVPRAGIFASVSGTEAARATPGITDLIVTAKPGYPLVPLPEGSGYTGFLFAEADTPAAAETALRQAHARLDFEILATLPIVNA